MPDASSRIEGTNGLAIGMLSKPSGSVFFAFSFLQPKTISKTKAQVTFIRILLLVRIYWILPVGRQVRNFSSEPVIRLFCQLAASGCFHCHSLSSFLFPQPRRPNLVCDPGWNCGSYHPHVGFCCFSAHSFS